MGVQRGQDRGARGARVRAARQAFETSNDSAFKRFAQALVNLQHSSGSHDGRFFLARRETSGAPAIGVDPREALSIAVENGHLPMAVFAALIGSKTCDPLFFGFGFRGCCGFSGFRHQGELHEYCRPDEFSSTGLSINISAK
jgi:hypothetical protein